MSGQPVPETWLTPRRGQRLGFLFGLAPDGVFRASALALGAVGSYPTFSPLPAPRPPKVSPGRQSRPRRSYFLWHYPSKSVATFRPHLAPRRNGELRGITPCGVRTFLPRLAPEAILRPSKIKERHKLYHPGNNGKRSSGLNGARLGRWRPAAAR